MARRRRARKSRSSRGSDVSQLGGWAFLIGGLIAVVHAFYPVPYAGWIFVIAGLIIGWVNISRSDAISFLIVVLALTVGSVSGWLNIIPNLGGALSAIVANIVALLSPAALLVALKAAYAMAKK